MVGISYTSTSLLTDFALHSTIKRRAQRVQFLA